MFSEGFQFILRILIFRYLLLLRNKERFNFSFIYLYSIAVTTETTSINTVIPFFLNFISGKYTSA